MVKVRCNRNSRVVKHGLTSMGMFAVMGKMVNAGKVASVGGGVKL
jgi:hypothetical protein